LPFKKRKEDGKYPHFVGRGCAGIAPTYLQCELTFNLDDYGKKEGITNDGDDLTVETKQDVT
jgi:hypothetical protein